MATITGSKSYFPDLNNMSYDDTAWFLYGVDCDEVRKKKEYQNKKKQYNEKVLSQKDR